MDVVLISICLHNRGIEICGDISGYFQTPRKHLLCKHSPAICNHKNQMVI